MLCFNHSNYTFLMLYNTSLRSEFRLAKISDEGARASRDESFFNDLLGF